MFSTLVVANSILAKNFEDEILINNMKLQRILYFVASRYAQITGEQLFASPFETWAYGPVQYEVYCYFSGLKNKPIKKYSRNVLGESKQYIEEENQNLYTAIRQI